MPNANIGIRTGSQSGIFVLDLDGRRVLRHWRSWKPRIVLSPGRRPLGRVEVAGISIAYPKGLEIRKRTKVLGLPIDVRGEGGYVIAAGSNHPKGEYVWEVSPDEVAPPEAPEWLLRIITNHFPRNGSTQSADDWLNEVTGELDLRTAPGVSQGNRHNRLLQLVGAEYGRRTDPWTVMALASDWGKLCPLRWRQARLLESSATSARRIGHKRRRSKHLGRSSTKPNFMASPERSSA